MCGIAGIFHLETAKPVDPARVEAMAEALAHRGPDGAGVWTGQGVGLGHRRLSVIDLAGGDQPMATTDGRFVTVFNGEIYNFRELRAELEARGHVFRTACDTEAILHGWRQWGTDAPAHFHGMFAFALYDVERRTLHLVRDRLGVKPLHYTQLSDGSLAFASELKGLLAHPLLRRRPDIRAVEDFFAWGYVPDDACLVAGVEKLPAGHILSLESGRPAGRPQAYWDVAFDPVSRRDGGAAEQLLDHLDTAVRSRMIADVPLGAFLSGGVDSSSVVALMAGHSRQAVKTCSIGFAEAGHDESAYAKRVAARFATDHRARTVEADDFSLIDTLVEAFDEPFADASALPTYRVCELARETVTVALSGDGADEAFAGYRRHIFHDKEDRARALLPAGLRRPLFGTLGRLYPKMDWAPQFLRAKTTFQGLARASAEAYAASVGVTGPALRGRLFTDAFRADLQGHRAEDRYVRAIETAPAEDGLAAAQYADLKIWLPGDILTKIDRMSMAVSLEAREPLLDHRLVEFAASLPRRQRVRGGEGKWLMKRAMRAHLPEDILYRRKQGFVTPISDWFRGELAGEAAALAASKALAETGWFDRAEIARMAEQHKSGRAEYGRQLWQLLMLEKSMERLFA